MIQHGSRTKWQGVFLIQAEKSLFHPTYFNNCFRLKLGFSYFEFIPSQGTFFKLFKTVFLSTGKSESYDSTFKIQLNERKLVKGFVLTHNP